jgi:hypothetical protein
VLRSVAHSYKPADVQTFELGRFAYTDYASIAGFDNYANTTSNLIGGLFNFAAALYYTNQVMRVSDQRKDM